MRKTLLVTLSLFFCLWLSAQSVATFAGKTNDDAFNKYESGSAQLDNTYFSLPEGLCFDANGVLYISERNKVRIVSGTKAYIRAGSLQKPALSEGYKNGSGTQTTFRVPGGMASDNNGNIFVADKENHCIRKINKYINLGNVQGVSTFAGAAPTPGLPGNGTSGYTNGTGTSARFDTPTDIAIDANGYLYVTEYNNFTVRKISPSGVVTTLAGNGTEGTSDGTASAARFGGPWGIAMLDANNIVVSDPWNTNIRKINIFSGQTSTLAGPTSGSDSRQVDGTLSAARFKNPKGIAVVNGIIYVGDENTIRAINVANNSVTTFAGDKSSYTVSDGNGSNAAFTQISDIESDGLGNLYVSENSQLVASSVIRKVSINNLAPAADFSAPKRSIVTGEKVVLSDISGGQEATSRTWTISPVNYIIHSGDLSTKSLEVSYSATGFYEVELSITNDYGTDSKKVEAYFSVSTTGSVNKYLATDLISLFPNPANTVLNINLDASLKTPGTLVKMYNVNGLVVKNLEDRSNITTSDLPSGTYYITVTNKEVSFAKRLLISH